jgi:D-glycero-D-manno-heptose 1,7-bisphosphate phosphatase
MILAARDRYGLDLALAVMVGDSEKDILAGRAAGCGATVLVQTGNGKKTLQSLEPPGQQPDRICTDLDHAVQWILHRRG